MSLNAYCGPYVQVTLVLEAIQRFREPKYIKVYFHSFRYSAYGWR